MVGMNIVEAKNNERSMNISKKNTDLCVEINIK